MSAAPLSLPWKALHNDAKTVDIVHDARSRTVAQTYGENRAVHARLIAAAPDLLAVVLELPEALQFGGRDGAYLNEEFEPLLNRARAAIAKAEGESK